MLFVLFILFFFISLFSFYLYPKSGKNEFLKMDSVQFIFAFIVAPLTYIWLKSFLFYIIQQEYKINLTITQVFFIDTIFSLVAIYVISFNVIHSLTKSFNLKRKKDPLYDLFEDSEFMHGFLSHSAIYIGLFVLITFLSIVNLFYPLSGYDSKIELIPIIIGSSILAYHVFESVKNTDIGTTSYFKFNKIMYAAFFILFIGLYYHFKPRLNLSYFFYWIGFSSFFSLVILSFVIEKKEKPKNLITKSINKVKQLVN